MSAVSPVAGPFCPGFRLPFAVAGRILPRGSFASLAGLAANLFEPFLNQVFFAKQRDKPRVSLRNGPIEHSIGSDLCFVQSRLQLSYPGESSADFLVLPRLFHGSAELLIQFSEPFRELPDFFHLRASGPRVLLSRSVGTLLLAGSVAAALFAERGPANDHTESRNQANGDNSLHASFSFLDGYSLRCRPCLLLPIPLSV